MAGYATTRGPGEPCFVEPALELLGTAGAEVRFNQRLRAIDFEAERATRLHFAEGSVAVEPGERVVIALPPTVAAAAGIDAVAHAVETAATTKRNKISRSFSMEAWRLLDAAFETAMRDPDNDEARSGMLLGAHLAGAAIENSMLGAAHACANPLTAKFGIVHGVAVGIMLPHVVRYNASSADNPYADIEASADRLAERIESFLDAGNHPRSLAAVDVPAESLPALAESAAKQWTATFNPVPVGAAELLDIYRRALE